MSLILILTQARFLTSLLGCRFIKVWAQTLSWAKVFISQTSPCLSLWSRTSKVQENKSCVDERNWWVTHSSEKFKTKKWQIQEVYRLKIESPRTKHIRKLSHAAITKLLSSCFDREHSEQVQKYTGRERKADNFQSHNGEGYEEVQAATNCPVFSSNKWRLHLSTDEKVRDRELSGGQHEGFVWERERGWQTDNQNK